MPSNFSRLVFVSFAVLFAGCFSLPAEKPCLQFESGEMRRCPEGTDTTDAMGEESTRLPSEVLMNSACGDVEEDGPLTSEECFLAWEIWLRSETSIQ